jgi:hypothetical protein
LPPSHFLFSPSLFLSCCLWSHRPCWFRIPFRQNKDSVGTWLARTRHHVFPLFSFFFSFRSCIRFITQGNRASLAQKKTRKGALIVSCAKAKIALDRAHTHITDITHALLEKEGHSSNDYRIPGRYQCLHEPKVLERHVCVGVYQIGDRAPGQGIIRAPAFVSSHHTMASTHTIVQYLFLSCICFFCVFTL